MVWLVCKGQNLCTGFTDWTCDFVHFVGNVGALNIISCAMQRSHFFHLILELYQVIKKLVACCDQNTAIPLVFGCSCGYNRKNYNMLS